MTTPRILIAEDERDIRELIVLQMQGYQVTDVPNGKIATEKAQEIKPDLILAEAYFLKPFTPEKLLEKV